MKSTVPLRFNHEFGRVYKRGKYYPGRHCVLHCMRNGRNVNRLGITTGRKVKGSVHRNRIRRLMRESYRLNEMNLTTGHDIVLLGRDEQGPLTCSMMESDIVSLLKRAGIWMDKGEEAKGGESDR